MWPTKIIFKKFHHHWVAIKIYWIKSCQVFKPAINSINIQNALCPVPNLNEIRNEVCFITVDICVLRLSSPILLNKIFKLWFCCGSCLTSIHYRSCFSWASNTQCFCIFPFVKGQFLGLICLNICCYFYNEHFTLSCHTMQMFVL